MNPYYTQEKDGIERRKFDRDHIAYQFLQDLIKLCQENIGKEEFSRLAKERGLNAETVESFRLGKITPEVEEKLRGKYPEDKLVSTGWYKHQCKICDEGYRPKFTELEELQLHLKNEHNHEKNKEEINDWVSPIMPEKGIIIPYLEDGDVIYANIRNTGNPGDNGKYRRPHHSFPNPRTVFRDGIYQATDKRDKLLIVEGEFDALAAFQEGYDAVSTGGISMREETKQRLAEIIREYKETVYIADNDIPGLLAVASLAGEMQFRDRRIKADVSEEGDLSDQLASENEINIDGKKPQKLLLDNFEVLDENERRIKEVTNVPAKDAEEAYYLSLVGLKESRVGSWAKKLPGAIEEARDMKPSKRKIKKEAEEFKGKISSSMKESDSESRSQEEDDFDVARKLELDGDDIEINPITSLHVHRHLETQGSILSNEAGVVRNRSEFKVYEFSFGTGEREKKFKLILDSDQNLNIGDQILPLKQADLSKERYQKWLREKYRKSDTDSDFPEFVDNQLEGNVFVKTGEIPESSKEKLLSMENEKIKGIVEKYLKDGHEYDKKLRRLTFPKLVRHDKTKVSPEEVMPFNPHSIYLTGSSIGKSYTADKVGVKKDDVSAAGLLGYASADEVRHGTLHGKDKAFFADEMRHSKEHNIGNQFLSILQQGANKQSKGKKDIKTEFYGSMTYMSNPKSNGNQKGPWQYFLDFINKIGDNARANGARFGVILLDLGEMKKAEGQALPAEKRDKLASLVSWIENKVAEEYSEIEREMKSWLNQGYPDDYEKAIRSWKPSVYSSKVEDWLEGHMESHRHTRGQALRMAVFENIGKVLKGDYSIDEIRREAENQFSKVMEINLESLSRLTEHLSDEDRVVQIKESMIQAESTLYEKLFIKTVIAHERAGGNHGDIDSVQALKPTWSNIKHDLDEVDEGDKYWKFSAIISQIEKNLESKQNHFEEIYGIWLTREKGNLFYNIIMPKEMNFCTKVRESVVPSPEVTDVTDETTVAS